MPRLRWVIFFAASTLLVSVTLTAFVKELDRLERLSRAADKRMDELVRITRESQVLEEKIRYYRTPEGIARLAREEFNLFMPNEQVYRIKIVSAD